MATTTDAVRIPRMVGARWLASADYLTADDKAKILVAVERVTQLHRDLGRTGARVGVRPAAYTGEPHPIATVIVRERGGESIGEIVYR